MEGGTALQRMRTLQELRYVILPFDITPYFEGGNRFFRRITHKLVWGPAISALKSYLPCGGN